MKIVEGTSSSQTIVVFVNRKVTSQQLSPEVASNPQMTAVGQSASQGSAPSFLNTLRDSLIAWLDPRSTAAYVQ